MDGKSRISRMFIASLIGFCICGWMFFLGILVGRGTAPVSFDTRSFQASLAKMTGESEQQGKTFEKPVLDFYEALKSPMLSTTVKAQDKNLSRANNLTQGEKVSQGEILPVGADLHGGENMGPQVLKKSLKRLTFKLKSAVPPNRKDLLSHGEKIVVKKDKKIQESNVKNGEYTIQVAAFRELTDAVEEIERLKARGISSYKTVGRVGSNIWHRVRTGSFNDMESAQKRQRDLAGLGIKGMILNKEE